MFRYGYVPPKLMGFWAQTSLNKGPFFGRFSTNMGGLSINWQKIVKNSSFSSKIHHRSGYDRKFRKLERGYLSENRAAEAADSRPSASHVPRGRTRS